MHFRRIRLPDIALPIIGIVLRLRYWLRSHEIRRCARSGKIRVLFIIGDKAKWKADLLYRALAASDRFEPIVCPAVMDSGFYRDEELRNRLLECKAYFEKHGYKVRSLNNEESLVPVRLQELNPGIIVYLQPWGMAKAHQPIVASECALTYYLPYCTFSYGNRLEMFDLPFVRFVYCHLMDNARWVDYYRKLSTPFRFGCQMVAAGSPYCEKIARQKSVKSARPCVIFAPHWSFRHKKNISKYYLSTFDWSGKFMLEFAIAHPEVKWIFKPHPGLRSKLESTGFMSHKEIEDYYSAWERLGEVNYDSDYDGLFAESTAMVTDCSTFLMEYLITGKPLIRLETSSPVKPLPPNELIIDAFYTAADCEALKQVLNDVVVESRDLLSEVRMQVRHKMGLDDIHSVDTIMTYFLNIVA